jgi:hypothetical protein
MMGVSTDAQISFGILFKEEEAEFPWHGEKYDWDIEEWWRDERGYKPPFEIWEESSAEHKKGITPAQKSEYYKHRKEWLQQNPVPATEVNYCSGEFPMYILAVPSTVLTAYRGHPVELVPAQLIYPPKASVVELRAFYAFIEKYFPEHLSPGPNWRLTSYWG